MGHKRVLLLAHGKKAETAEFKEAYAWLEKDGHDIDLMKTGSPEDMSKGVQKLVSHFGGKHSDCGSLPLTTSKQRIGSSRCSVWCIVLYTPFCPRSTPVA